MGKDSPGPKYRGGLVKAKLLAATSTHLIGQSFPKEERMTSWVPKDIERINKNLMPLSPRTSNTGKQFFEKIGSERALNKHKSHAHPHLQRVDA